MTWKYMKGGFKNNPKTESETYMKQCFMPGHLPMPHMYPVVSTGRINRVLIPPSNYMQQKHPFKQSN